MKIVQEMMQLTMGWRASRRRCVTISTLNLLSTYIHVERSKEQLEFIVAKVKEIEGTRAATISDVTKKRNQKNGERSKRQSQK